MRKIFNHIYNVLFLISTLTIVSCVDHGDLEPDDNGSVSQITVVCSDPIQSRSTTEYPGDVDPIIINSFTDDESLLYISQLGASENPNFTNLTAEEGSLCYVYKYYENEESNWNKEYNFKVSEETGNVINWRRVRQLGSVGNAFSFYSFFFPVKNKVTFEVQADQTDEDDFMMSDIMGAYHATSALNSRLRFRLYHLMVYLKVTLYVPVYESEANDGSEYHYSGYDEGSLLGAFLLDANTEFNVEWRANRSSDTDAPLTNAYGNKHNIQMYQHPDDDNIYTLENVKEYYPTYNGEDTDDVRAYNFSVLFPAQTFGNNFLCFVLKDHEGNNRYFYFSGNQVVGDSGNYNLTQGTLQQLYLYLPRKTNETILIGAKILPWSNGVTDMTVTKDETNDSN